MSDSDSVKIKRPRLTVEEAWYPRERSMLVLATQEEKSDIIDGYRDAATASEMRAKALSLRTKADDLDRAAAEMKDQRNIIEAAIRARASTIASI